MLGGKHMSLLDSLTSEFIWNDFLESKVHSNTLPQKIIEEYKEFIENKRYRKIATAIANHSYSFSIPRKVLIGKMGKKKKRTVYIFEKTENYVLKMLNHLLYQYDSMFTPNLYSFRKNHGVKDAIYTIIKTKDLHNMYAYKADIQNYFNSIPLEKLLPPLKKDLHDDSLYQLMADLLLNKQVLYESNIQIEEKKESWLVLLYPLS